MGVRRTGRVLQSELGRLESVLDLELTLHQGTSLDLGLDCRKALDLLVSCPHVQEVFSLSKQDLFQRLTISWNPDRALQDG